MKRNKIVLIGSGHVGSSFAYALVSHGSADELAIIDIDTEKAEADVWDLNHTTPFSHKPVNVYIGDYSDCQDADIIVICASASLPKGETRLKLLEDNVEIFVPMVQKIVDQGFDGHIILPSNPVDIMSYVVKKVSGFPKSKVIGTGTLLDSSRFQYYIGQALNVAPQSVYAPVVGEHGDSQIAVWSHARVAGEPVLPMLQQRYGNNVDAEVHRITEITKNVGYDIYVRKSTTCFGVALGILRVVEAILNNQNIILNVSSYVEGEYGLTDLYIGTPTRINGAGAQQVIELKLTEEEQHQLQQSAAVIHDYQQRADALIEKFKK